MNDKYSNKTTIFAKANNGHCVSILVDIADEIRCNAQLEHANSNYEKRGNTSGNWGFDVYVDEINKRFRGAGIIDYEILNCSIDLK